MEPDFVRLFFSLEIFANLTMLVPLGLAWLGRSLLSASLRILAIVPAFLLVMYTASWIGDHFFHYNLVVGHVTVFGEGLLYLWYLRCLLSNTRYQKWAPYFQAIFIVFGLIDSFFLEGFKQLNTYTNVLESLLVTALVLMYFEHKLHIPTSTPHMSRDPAFSANVGIVLYLVGTVVTYSIINHFIISNDAGTIYRILIVNMIMQLVLSTFMARCFWLARRVKSSSELVVTGL